MYIFIHDVCLNIHIQDNICTIGWARWMKIFQEYFWRSTPIRTNTTKVAPFGPRVDSYFNRIPWAVNCGFLKTR